MILPRSVKQAGDVQAMHCRYRKVITTHGESYRDLMLAICDK